MVGVVGWDHRSWSCAVDQRPAVQGLEVVVVFAEAIEIAERGLTVAAPFASVVDLEAVDAPAALDGAARL